MLVPKRGVVSSIYTKWLFISAMMTSCWRYMLLLDLVWSFATDLSRRFSCRLYFTHDNVKFWLKNFGLGCRKEQGHRRCCTWSLYVGPHRLELAKFCRAWGFFTISYGAGIQHYACAEDCDPELLIVLKQKSLILTIDFVVILKWRNLHASSLSYTKLTASGLMVLAKMAGRRLYNIVREVTSMCEPLLETVQTPNQERLGKTQTTAMPFRSCEVLKASHWTKKTRMSVIAQTRLHCNSMGFQVSLVHRPTTVGGKESRYDRIEAHQELLRRGELVRWIDLPIDAHIIFFSHEWVGWNHPDPHGVQLKTFLRVMKRLRSGEISQVEMNVFHTFMYKQNYVAKADEWQDILSRA